MEGTVQRQIAEMKRELLAIKTAAKVAPSIRCYSKTVSLNLSGRAKITYGDGTQPIISEAYRDNDWGWGCFLGQVTGNTQYVFTGSASNSNLTVTSTRPIISIEAA